MSKAAAYEFLSNHHLGVLSTISADGKPWGAAIYFAVNEHLDVYFLTATNGKKYEDMQRHAAVALTAYDDATQATVQLTGTVERLDIGDEMNDAYAKLAGISEPGSHVWAPPVSKLHESELAVMHIVPDHVQLADFKNKTDGEQCITQVM